LFENFLRWPCSWQGPFRDIVGAVTIQFNSLQFGFRIILHNRIFRLTSHFSLAISTHSSLFLSILSSSTSIHAFANIFASFFYQYIDTLPLHHSNTYLQQRSSNHEDLSSYNKHNPHHANQQEQAIMSDAPDSTFTAGETKLLISIMKNLTGDLQVRLLCFLLCMPVSLHCHLTSQHSVAFSSRMQRFVVNFLFTSIISVPMLEISGNRFPSLLSDTTQPSPCPYLRHISSFVDLPGHAVRSHPISSRS
jgi:hypothetical protein